MTEIVLVILAMIGAGVLGAFLVIAFRTDPAMLNAVERIAAALEREQRSKR